LPLRGILLGALLRSILRDASCDAQSDAQSSAKLIRIHLHFEFSSAQTGSISHTLCRFAVAVGAWRN
jgi:hypothetical protein